MKTWNGYFIWLITPDKTQRGCADKSLVFVCKQCGYRFEVYNVNDDFPVIHTCRNGSEVRIISGVFDNAT